MSTPQIKLRSGITGGQSSSQPSGQSNGGTWYGGVFYPDYSGSCSTATPPPTNQGGTWYGGVFYPDFSGTCTTQST
jgi:hypothetical protein